MSNEEPAFHRGRWWVKRGGTWLYHDGVVWVRAPETPSGSTTSRIEIAGLAAGIVGFVAAVEYQAIGGGLLFLFPGTALGLGFGAAMSSTRGMRRALGMWALVLGSVALGLVVGIVGARLGLFSGAIVYAATPMLIGIAAILLSAMGLIVRRGRPKASAILGVVLGIATVVNGFWGIRYVDRLQAGLSQLRLDANDSVPRVRLTQRSPQADQPVPGRAVALWPGPIPQWYDRKN